ncbi:hypothetical protein AN641_07490 [Candidatus Epulonipiscioides gigas]|nr:hypothetical protein AN641_07490 [Epulopiscium sp. SCG-C07WGA-EpuloA2]
MKNQVFMLFITYIAFAGQTTFAAEQSFDYQVNPSTFEVVINDIMVSQPYNNEFVVKEFQEIDNKSSWTYPDNNIAVDVEKMNDYLAVTISSTTVTDNSITWPIISGEEYYMPLGSGKQFKNNDSVWASYLSGKEFYVLEEWSMPFFATIQDDKAIVYIIEDPYRNTIYHDVSDTIGFNISQEFVAIDDDREKTIRIYVTDAEPASVAKIYRDFVIENDNFVSLEEKAQLNPNIEKLYGAPHIYLAGSYIVSPNDINWNEFKAKVHSPVMQYILSFSNGMEIEVGKEVSTVIKEIFTQDYISMYQKNLICRYLTDILLLKDFYNPEIFEIATETLKYLATKKDEAAYIDFNKEALATNLPSVFAPANEWMNAQMIDVLTDLNSSGINTAWIGLHSWEQAYNKPQLALTATKLGYLIGPYDSYHSIHEPNKEQWITAKFDDTLLYENATITNKEGNKISGFKQVGRKLNPTLTMDVVDGRVSNIVDAEPNFNSWFIDCDATGEIYDDYSIGNITTQREDLQARLDRMSLIRDDYNMVIGSEGGNDFAASTIAFAHGIELRAFSWMDNDMRSNKNSEYYQGSYYNASGGVTPNFSKRIPLKDHFYELFVNPAYDIPLFKLVYNDSVISTYHWGWSTFKIQDATVDRMLREVLYNIPPLYHLDDVEWKKYKDDIILHNNVWSEFSKQVINKEMTDFQNLTDDGMVQLTKYGADIRVITNFSDNIFTFEQINIPANSLIIDNNIEIKHYSPSVSSEHQ